MRRGIVIVALMVGNACRHRAPAPQAPSSGMIHLDQPEAEVRRLLGEPQRTGSHEGGSALVYLTDHGPTECVIDPTLELHVRDGVVGEVVLSTGG